MKLSDIRNERTLDVVAAIIGPISRIAANKETAQYILPQKPPENADKATFLAERASGAVSALLTNHRSDVVCILAALEGVSEADYMGSLNLAKLGRDLFELMTDSDFVALFPSAQSTKASSGSASVSSVEDL